MGPCRGSGRSAVRSRDASAARANGADAALPRWLLRSRDGAVNRPNRAGHRIAVDARPRPRARHVPRRIRMTDDRLRRWLESAEQPMSPDPEFAAALHDELRGELGFVP